MLNDKETSCLDGWVMKRDEGGWSGGEEEAGRGVRRLRGELRLVRVGRSGL